LGAVKACETLQRQVEWLDGLNELMFFHVEQEQKGVLPIFVTYSLI
jgi:hypothetical protein